MCHLDSPKKACRRAGRKEQPQGMEHVRHSTRSLRTKAESCSVHMLQHGKQRSGRVICPPAGGFCSWQPSHPEWEVIGRYSECVSGTKKEKRPVLLQRLRDCRDGRINLMLVKNISRCARNVTALLDRVRGLTATGMAILFDRENIDIRMMRSECLMMILGSLAATSPFQWKRLLPETFSA